MSTNEILTQIPSDEKIATKLYDSHNNLLNVITMSFTGRTRRYKLYAPKDEKLVFTNKMADSPLLLEEGAPWS